ncbi:hypothetical protein B0H63DRAFT_110140 [Podospora didyma]|uniref:Clr5 domain-containing protein n=1 Tax=Podospora didyma TaxID=330526 RepID=A0AAE0NYV9_9PEZI|nr:hypothetical protein B0H63DRAFT_110140 [Podospora didyma]
MSQLHNIWPWPDGSRQTQSEVVQDITLTSPSSNMQSAPRQIKIIQMAGSTGPHAPRIAEEVWERWKPIIVENYGTNRMTQMQLKEYMEREHGFIATKRQYVHRLGTIWGIGKYKKKNSNNNSNNKRSRKRRNSDNPPDSDQSLEQPTFRPGNLRRHQDGPVYNAPMDSEEVRRLYRHAGDLCLAAFGDGHSAFQIYHKLYRDQSTPVHDVAACNRHVVDCNRAQQTGEHADLVEEMLQANINILYPKGSPPSWRAVLFHLIMAHRYDREPTDGDATSQIERVIDNQLLKTYNLAVIPQRGFLLDVEAYIYLSYSLARYNEATVDPDERININQILGEFIAQQPALINGTSPSCLLMCTNWCIGVLEGNPKMPAKFPSSNGNLLVGTYKVLCTLWCAWVHGAFPRSPQGNHRTPTIPPHPATWADQTVSQLAISPGELLTNVVCMIMTAGPQQQGRNSTIRDALEGAKSLQKLAVEDGQIFIHRFLGQVRKNNDRRMTHQMIVDFDADLATENWELIKPFRSFIADEFKLVLPELSGEAFCLPVALNTGEDDDEEDYDDEDVYDEDEDDPYTTSQYPRQSSHSRQHAYPASPLGGGPNLRPCMGMDKLQIGSRPSSDDGRRGGRGPTTTPLRQHQGGNHASSEDAADVDFD